LYIIRDDQFIARRSLLRKNTIVFENISLTYYFEYCYETFLEKNISYYLLSLSFLKFLLFRTTTYIINFTFRSRISFRVFWSKIIIFRTIVAYRLYLVSIENLDVWESIVDRHFTGVVPRHHSCHPNLKY